MNRRLQFSGLIGLAALCQAFAQEYQPSNGVAGASLNHSFVPEPRAQIERTFTPEMRELVTGEVARLAIAKPHLNAKQRKKMARKKVLEVS